MQFNETKDSVAERTETTNYEGGQAFDPDTPELALTKRVIANLLEDSFYESDTEKFDAVKQEFERVADTNPEFALKLAKYARQEEGLRQVPQVLLVLAANHDAYKDTGWVRAYAPDIMSRADEPLEAIAMQTDMYGTSVPHSLQKGIEDALHQWNEHQFAKWDRKRRETRYRDLFNLVHPKPRDDERERIFEKIAHGDLSDYEVEPLREEGTIESSLSNKEDDRSKADVYREELSEDGGSMGLYARIKNVRNMLEAGLSGEEIFGDVTDEWIRNSKLWPFRFYQAYKAVREARDVPDDRYALDWLEDAIDTSAGNMPDIFEDAFVAVDTSGSMTGTVSGKSDLTQREIAALFGAIGRRGGADVGAFARDFQYLNIDARNPIVTNTENIRTARVGGATNGYLVPETLRQDGRSYERVIVFTDMQMWDSGSAFRNTNTFRDSWNSYVAQVGETNLYLVDLESYGDLTMPEGANNVYNISGWSDKVIEFIDKMEHSGEMVEEIQRVEP